MVKKILLSFALLVSFAQCTLVEAGVIGVVQLSATKCDQRPKNTCPTKVLLDTNDLADGIQHNPEGAPGDIIILEDSYYFVIAAPQVSKLKGSEAACANFWLRVNGEDVANSNVKVCLNSKGECLTTAIPQPTVLFLRTGDLVNVYMSVDSPKSRIGLSIFNPCGQPTVPGIKVSLFRLNLNLN